MDTRLSNLRRLMKKQQLDAVFVSSLSNITYLTNFSGFSNEDRDAFLLVTNDKQYIFTHGIYKEAVGKFINDYALMEMKRESPVSKSLGDLIAKHKIKKLGFEAFDLKYSEYENLLKFVSKKITKQTIIVNDLRIIKSPNEIEAIKKACQLGDKTYTYILKYLRMTLSEKEIAYEIEYFIRKNGAEPSFPTIVAFGSNASFPHHVPTEKKLTKNMFVLMDFGTKLDNYCSDMTRTIFFGKANYEQKNIYQSVLDAQQKAIQQFNNLTKKQSKNIKAKRLDDAARKHITSTGYPTIPHSLGHGIGLEVHEDPKLTPYSKDELKNGMVFSIEPGVYLPGKFGVRIEDLYVLENNKLIPLTHSPKELIEI